MKKPLHRGIQLLLVVFSIAAWSFLIGKSPLGIRGVLVLLAVYLLLLVPRIIKGKAKL